MTMPFLSFIPCRNGLDPLSVAHHRRSLHAGSQPCMRHEHLTFWMAFLALRDREIGHPSHSFLLIIGFRRKLGRAVKWCTPMLSRSLSSTALRLPFASAQLDRRWFGVLDSADLHQWRLLSSIRQLSDGNTSTTSGTMSLVG